MSATCRWCNTSGGNMKKCTQCGIIWCANSKCLEKRFGIKSIACNICPACGGYNTVKSAG